MPIRMFSVPAAYRNYLEGEIANAVETVRQDLWRRGQHLPPKIPDFAIHGEEKGTTLVVFDQPVDDAEADPVVPTFTDRVRPRSAA